MGFVLGIDEAGRGPVIGPMVMAAVVFDESVNDELRAQGVKDSKLLLPGKRRKLYEYVKKHAVGFEVAVISPAEIDKVLDPAHPLNLNWLEAIESAKLINKLKPIKVILDCPSPTPEKYAAYVKQRLNDQSIVIQAEHKADVNYPIVAAASIIAKEIREREIAKLREKVGDFGSGYQSDPKTIEFIQKHWKTHHQIFRKSWSTYKKIKAENSQMKLGGF